MTRYRIKSPNDIWLRRATFLLAVALILGGVVILKMFVGDWRSVNASPFLRPLGFALIFGTPFGAFFSARRIRHLNESGPFGFDSIFTQVLFTMLWVSLVSLVVLFLVTFSFTGWPPDIATAIFSLLALLTFIVFGAMVTFFAGIPLVLVIAALFRLVALEPVDEGSDKTSWEQAV